MYFQNFVHSIETDVNEEEESEQQSNNQGHINVGYVDPLTFVDCNLEEDPEAEQIYINTPNSAKNPPGTLSHFVTNCDNPR